MYGMRKLVAWTVLAVGLVLASPVPLQGQSRDDAQAQYEQARRALNSAQYTQAIELFRAYRNADTERRYAAESLYYEAFALSRLPGSRNLKEALAALELQIQRYPDASTSGDAKALLARVRGELANRGDSKSAEWVYREAAERDRDAEREFAEQSRQERSEADETKLMALNALMQMDSEKAIPILRKVIQNRDNHPELRAQALFILTQQDDSGATDLMLDVARNDPDPEVREQAVFWLSQNDGPETVSVLRSILSNPADARLHEHAVFALSQLSDPAAGTILREYAGSDSADPDVRANAVFWLAQHGTAEDAVFLKDLFRRSGDDRTREAILFGLSQMPDQGNGRWLMDIAVDPSEDTGVRAQALFMAHQAGGVSAADVVGVYDRAGDRELKVQALYILSQQKDRVAIDKLLDVARSESDAEIRQQAIFWLGQSGDPRAEQALLDILDE